mmetsp:Transcript_10003/g.16388  ORF Transcript_10003/g.16388 Transcript_10003/m.16388 type:complete len:224 (+) Transcript_10003:1056-1727(+)
MSRGEMVERSEALYHLLNQRRSLRFYSSEKIPEQVIKNCVLAAGTAPSGAHCQPWHFAIVTDPKVKQKIRQHVEAEEQKNYEKRMRREWVQDVTSLVSDLHDIDDKNHTVKKPYLTEAPAICVVLKETHGVDEEGKRVENYYVEQSVGLAVGLFLAAVTNAGLSTLTSTPMGAEKKIRELVGAPERYKTYLLMPLGYAADNATVPFRDSTTLRKPLDSIASFI